MEEGLETTAFVLTESTSDLISGGIGGMAGVLAGAPLDTIRIRQQQAVSGRVSAPALLRSTLINEGFPALFRGMSYPLCTAALQNAVCFHSYGSATRHIMAPHANLAQCAVPSLSQVFWAGCFAGLVQTFVVTPIDLLKIRLQLQTAVPGSPAYRGPLRTLQSTLQTDGFCGLYRGAVITAIRDVPSHGVYFAAFEGAREWLTPGSREQRGSSRQSAAAIWAAGGIAGAVSWVSVYPFDVIKSRLQATSAAASPWRGWVDCAMQAVQNEGVGVFFRGLNATLCRAFLVNGAIFTAFEASHNVLKH